VINKISFQGVINNKPTEQITAPTFKSKIKQEELKELNGLEAQAVYMTYIVQPKKDIDDSNLEKLELINPEYKTENIEGEKIYNSAGELDSIVVENEETTIVYTPLKDNGDFIEEVKVLDKESGKELVSQKNYYEDGKLDEQAIIVTKKEDGETMHKWTHYHYYNSNESVESGIEYTKTDGSSKYIIKLGDGGYIVEETYSNGLSKSGRYDKDRNILSLDMSHTKGTTEQVRRSVEYIKGKPYSVETTNRTLNKHINIETLGIVDKGFAPALPTGVKTVDAKALILDSLENDEDEKTYYSNGALESITTKEGEKLVFTAYGEIKEAVYDGKKVTIGNNDQEIIEETLEGGKKKITTYFRDCDVKVELLDEEDDKKTIIYYNKFGKPSFVNFEKKDDDGNVEEFAFDFTEDGILEHYGRRGE